MEGEISLTITSSQNVVNDKTNLIIEVQDSGIGMDEEEQVDMFKAFTQHSRQSNKEYGGTGLGLSIVKRLVELMNGDVALKSERDVGSTFIITLKDVEISAEPIASNVESQKIVFEKATVLIADDITLNRDLIKEYLKETPLTLLEACDGQEAVDMTKENAVDLILMDVKMPNKNGYEATKEIKKFQDMPIIAITASVIFTQENKDNLIFDVFLQKPIKQNELLQALSKHLKCETTNVESSLKELNEIANVSLSQHPTLKNLLENAKNDGDIDLIQKFSDELDKFGEKENNEAFKILSTQLSSAVNSFDIGECEALLNKFE